MELRHVGWSLGNYCNARCDHCYSWKVRQSPRVLEAGDVDRILGQLAENRVATVNLGGNEPLFTHGPDARQSVLPRIVLGAREAGMTVGVTTNGTSALWLLRHRPDIFDAVSEWHFSIDSPFPEEHDRNRGGAFFALVERAVVAARRRGARAALVYCLMRLNAGDEHADALLDLAARWQTELRVNTLKPTDPHHGAMFPRPGEVYRFFGRLARRAEPVVVGESILAAMWGLPSEGCPCGTTSLRIHSITDDGRVPVSPCVFLHDLAVGDLLTQDLAEIVRSPPFEAMRRRREELPADCRARGCGLAESCRGGCSARALLAGGSLERRDPYCPADAGAAERAEAGLPCELRLSAPRSDRPRVHERYLCTVITGVPEAA